MTLLSGRTEGQVVVCRATALSALKLLAGHLQDLGDMFAMDGAVVDVSEMQGLLSLAESPALEDTLALVGRLTAGPKTYRDVGSRSAAGSPEKRENLRRWRYLQDRVAACIPNP